MDGGELSISVKAILVASADAPRRPEMPNTLTVEKASFTEKPVECLYFSSSSGKPDYLLVRYKDTKKFFKKKLRYEQPHIRRFTILSQNKRKGLFRSKNGQRVCLFEFDDENQIVIRVNEKQFKRLETGILERQIIDAKIDRSFAQKADNREPSNDVANRLEKLYAMWKDGILTKYEFKAAKKKVLNY
jgi:hypothetical protein